MAQVSFDDFGNETDFYTIVTIDGTQFNNRDSLGQEICEDTNSCTPNIFVVGFNDWVFTESVDFNKDSVPIVISVLDEDDNPDDIADIENGPGTSLNFNLNPKTCNISGEISGSCSMILSSMGNGEGDGNATISFEVELVTSGNGPGSQIYCLHTPIWPQPGEDITITAVALDDNLQPKEVDNVQILITTDPDPTASVDNDFFAAATVDPSETDFMYLCQVENNGNFVDTSWRELDVGTETGERAISVLSTGSDDFSQDIVFVPDQDNYSSANDPVFLKDVEKSIDAYYLGGLVFLENQGSVNFWLSQDTGNAVSFENSDCDHDEPATWNTDFAFANTGVLLHDESPGPPDDFRNCASNGLASANINDPDPKIRNVLVHELGHQPFGLADEYCNTRPGSESSKCDGGYFQTPDAPNVFETEPACLNDPDRGGKACQEILSQNKKTKNQDFFTYDPVKDDLMVDNQLPEFLDIRRILHVFGLCMGGGC